MVRRDFSLSRAALVTPRGKSSENTRMRETAFRIRTRACERVPLRKKKTLLIGLAAASLSFRVVFFTKEITLMHRVFV